MLEKGNKTGFISLLIKHNEVRGPRLMAMAFKNTKLLNRCLGYIFFFNLSSNLDNGTTEITIVTVLWRRKCYVRDASVQCVIFNGIIYKHLSRSCTACGLTPPFPLLLHLPFGAGFCGSGRVKNSVSLDWSESLTWVVS